MKKVLSGTATLVLSFFGTAQLAYADIVENVTLKGTQKYGISPETTLQQMLQSVFTIVFTIAAIAVLAMLIWGAVSWITSGGDKDAIAGARKRIMNALIGMAILALAFFIVRFVGQIVGIDIFTNLQIPTLGNPVVPTGPFAPGQGNPPSSR